MQSTLQCKDSDQCLLDGEVAVHAEHCLCCVNWVFLVEEIDLKISLKYKSRKN